MNECVDFRKFGVCRINRARIVTEAPFRLKDGLICGLYRYAQTANAPGEWFKTGMRQS